MRAVDAVVIVEKQNRCSTKERAMVCMSVVLRWWILSDMAIFTISNVVYAKLTAYTHCS